MLGVGKRRKGRSVEGQDGGSNGGRGWGGKIP